MIRRHTRATARTESLESRMLFAAGGGDPDVTPPAASLGPIADVVRAGEAIYMEVQFSDDRAILMSSLGDEDIRVTGPDGSAVPVRYQGMAPASAGQVDDGTPRTALYRVFPAGRTVVSGGFTAAGNGTYTVAVEPNQVSDSAGLFVPAGTIGTFRVNIPADGPNLAVGRVRVLRRRLLAAGASGAKASFLLRNTGTQPAAGTVTVVVIAGDKPDLSSGDFGVVGTTDVTLNLRPGARQRVVVPLDPAAWPPGRYYLVVHADNDGSVAEPDETDDFNVTAHPARFGNALVRPRRPATSLLATRRS